MIAEMCAFICRFPKALYSMINLNCHIVKRAVNVFVYFGSCGK